MTSLSLIVITKNEEASIARCLGSVNIADELVVVDSGSTDRTVEIARAHGAKVISTSDWPGFGPQKARALDLARGDWIISLDADEWIEPGSMAVIEKAIADVLGVPLKLRLKVDDSAPRAAATEAESTDALFDYANERIR